MARLEIEDYDGPETGYRRQVRIAISRRNLQSLLHKLDMEGSARRIENNHVKIDGELVGDVMLVLTAEDDYEHYAHVERGAAMGYAGAMHPETEAYIQATYESEIP